ncbi:unnamed protein product [Sphagnum troendelagicum]|uniref:C2H2-type domain-containing protein n=1 Tax=Sphagnum troendelagicum TaxID=128251 RepID=A0ABP0U7S3_9BRYO
MVHESSGSSVVSFNSDFICIPPKGKRTKRLRQSVRSLQAVTSYAPENSEAATTPTETRHQREIIDALMLLKAVESERKRSALTAPPQEPQVTDKEDYECTTCKRIFKSHQALGGHRASHKKVKGCYARTNDDNEEMFSIARKSKGHECSICHRVFNSGQALGGHKRCHWGHHQVSNPKREVLERELDLNMPAPESDDFEGSRVFEER